MNRRSFFQGVFGAAMSVVVAIYAPGMTAAVVKGPPVFFISSKGCWMLQASDGPWNWVPCYWVPC